MKRIRFMEEQTIAVFPQHKAGAKAADRQFFFLSLGPFRAAEHGRTGSTRSGSDFEPTGFVTLNPFDSRPIRNRDSSRAMMTTAAAYLSGPTTVRPSADALGGCDYFLGRMRPSVWEIERTALSPAEKIATSTRRRVGKIGSQIWIGQQRLKISNRAGEPLFELNVWFPVEELLGL